jgi:NhaP-type Na+/H+ or K+/H+ antiporter
MAGHEEEEFSSGTYIILFVALNLMFGSAVREALRRYNIPIPYTAIIFVFGMIWGSLYKTKADVLSTSASLIRYFFFLCHFILDFFFFLVFHHYFIILLHLFVWLFFSEFAVFHSAIDPSVLLGLFLPPLIFESAFTFNPYAFFKQFIPCLVLAVPGILVTIVLLAVIPVYILGYDWNWTIALIFGAILSSTDPVAVSFLLKEAGVSKRISTLVDGEALINDATAFVVFSILQESLSGHSESAGSIIGFFLQLALGGVLLGIVMGGFFCYWIRNTYNDPIQETVLTMTACYLTFWIAEFSHVMRVSGVIAVVSLGITMSFFRSVITPEVEHQVEHVWSLIGFLTNTLIFSISGVIVIQKVYSDYIDTIDFGWAMVMFIFMNLVRVVVVVIFSPFLVKFGYGINLKGAIILSHSGLRGAVALALAMNTERQPEIDENTKAQLAFQVCSMVFLTLIVNGITARPLLHFLKLDKAAPGSHMLYNEAMAAIKSKRQPLIEELRKANKYAGANWESVKAYLPSYRHVEKEIGDEPEISELAYSQGPVRRSSLVEGIIETQEDIYVFFEVNRRLLMAMNASYAEQYEERQISRKNFIFLRGAIEKALLTDDIRAHWKVVKDDHLRSSSLIKQYYDKKNSWIVARFAESLVKRELKNRYEVAGAFLRATRTFDKVLSVLPKYKKNPSIRTLKGAIRDFRRQASYIQLDIEKSFPELYEEIQTRQAAALMLYTEKEQILSLHKERGILEEKELNKMTSKLDFKLYELTRKNPLASRGLKKIDLASLPLIERIQFPDIKQRVIDNFERKLFQAGDLVFTKGSSATGLAIIVRGMATMRIGEKTVDCIGSGSIIECWCALEPSQKFFTDIRAETYLEVAFLKLEHISNLLAISQVAGDLWCTAASDILRIFFTDYFHGVESQEVVRLCRSSSLIQTSGSALSEAMPFPSGGLLLVGTLTIESPSSIAEEEEEKTAGSQKSNKSLEAGAAYEKPLLILPGNGTYRLGPDSRVLRFASGIWTPSQPGHGVVRPEDLQSYLDKHSPPVVFMGGFEKYVSEAPQPFLVDDEESKSGVRTSFKMQEQDSHITSIPTFGHGQ